MAFNLDTLRDLYAHMEWADATVWRVALAHPSGADDPRVRDLLLHLHTVQRAFLRVWTNQALDWPTAGQFPDLRAMQQWSRPTYDAARAFLDTLDPESIARPQVMPWAARLAGRGGREPNDATLADTIFQVTSHSTYHRGQLNARLRELGATPPLVDYIAWVWFGRPVPEWE